MSKAVFNNDSYETFVNKTSVLVPLQIITGQTATDPVVLTVAGHGIISGRTVTISGNTTTTPLINGEFIATVIDFDTFSIPVAVTVAGSDGTLQTEQGTIGDPRHITYYARLKTDITSISIASPAIVSTATPHRFTTGNYVYIQDTDSTPSLNGGRFVTVLSGTSFSVGVDTTGIGSTGIICLEQDATIRKDIIIDGYEAITGDPIFKGNLITGVRYNIADGRFDNTTLSQATLDALIVPIKTHNVGQLPFYDSNFTLVSVSGHITNLGSSIEDINNTTNLNWLQPSVATLLNIVSTSTEDAPAGSGVFGLILQGVDANYDKQQEIVFLSGTTPIQTSLTWIDMNVAIAIAGGTLGSGAAGRIAITSDDDGLEWAVLLTNDTAGVTARYTVPNASQSVLTNILFNGGLESDMTIRTFSQGPAPGNFPVSLGDTFISQGIEVVMALFPLPQKTTIRFRGFTNSGNPSQKKINCSFQFVEGPLTSWSGLFI